MASGKATGDRRWLSRIGQDTTDKGRLALRAGRAGEWIPIRFAARARAAAKTRSVDHRNPHVRGTHVFLAWHAICKAAAAAGRRWDASSAAKDQGLGRCTPTAKMRSCGTAQILAASKLQWPASSARTMRRQRARLCERSGALHHRCGFQNVAGADKSKRDTRVLSTVSWLPPQSGSPLAMIAMEWRSRTNCAASALQCPPISMSRITTRQRAARKSSAHVRSLATHDGAMLVVAKWRKRAVYPELMRRGPQGFCVLACEAGNRWNTEPRHAVCGRAGVAAPVVSRGSVFGALQAKSAQASRQQRQAASRSDFGGRPRLHRHTASSWPRA